MEDPKSRPDMLSVGEQAPDFTAVTDSGETVRLSEWRGQKRVALVFYPGDNTPLCTAQLCALRDEWPHFDANHAVIFGVNPASQQRHHQFADRHHFPFPLIADARGKIAAAFGCRGLFGMIRRTVYVVDRQGRIAFAQRGNPSPAEIMKALNAIDDDAPRTEPQTAPAQGGSGFSS